MDHFWLLKANGAQKSAFPAPARSAEKSLHGLQHTATATNSTSPLKKHPSFWWIQLHQQRAAPKYTRKAIPDAFVVPAGHTSPSTRSTEPPNPSLATPKFLSPYAAGQTAFAGAGLVVVLPDAVARGQSCEQTIVVKAEVEAKALMGQQTHTVLGNKGRLKKVLQMGVVMAKISQKGTLNISPQRMYFIVAKESLVPVTWPLPQRPS